MIFIGNIKYVQAIEWSWNKWNTHFFIGQTGHKIFETLDTNTEMFPLLLLIINVYQD